VERLILLTAFGPFPGVERNPSREVAAALEREPPPGVRILFRELPVTFLGAPPAIDAFLAEHKRERPAALVGIGVQRRATFRLERRARGRYDSERPDNDGLAPVQLGLDVGAELSTRVDLERLAEGLRRAGAPAVEISTDAGGYVCERTYHQLLLRGEELDLPTLFLHIPPATAMEPAEQVPFVRAMLELLPLK
jgi:pyroglutamyl-peptidase